MDTFENISSGQNAPKLNSIPRAHAIPLSNNYDYTSVNLIVASVAADSLREADTEVTHEVFFGENINRLKAIFKK